MPHLPCPAWQLAISSSHLIVLWLWPCSLKQRTQFNSRLISVTAPPTLLASPSPCRATLVSVVSHLPHLSYYSQLPHLFRIPFALFCRIIERRSMNSSQSTMPPQSRPPSCLLPLLLFLLLRLYLPLLTGRRTASFYLHTFGINWSSLFRVSFLTPFPSPSFPPWSGTTHT